MLSELLVGGRRELFGLNKRLNKIRNTLIIVILLAIGLGANGFVQGQLKKNRPHFSPHEIHIIKSKLKLDHFLIYKNTQEIYSRSFSGHWVLYFISNSNTFLPFSQITRMATMSDLVNRDFLFSCPDLVVLVPRQNHHEKQLSDFIYNQHLQSKLMVGSVNQNVMFRFKEIERQVLADRKGGLYLLVSPQGNLRAILPKDTSKFNLIKDFIVVRSSLSSSR
jgi:hypothetical protein